MLVCRSRSNGSYLLSLSFLSFLHCKFVRHFLNIKHLRPLHLTFWGGRSPCPPKSPPLLERTFNEPNAARFDYQPALLNFLFVWLYCFQTDEKLSMPPSSSRTFSVVLRSGCTKCIRFTCTGWPKMEATARLSKKLFYIVLKPVNKIRFIRQIKAWIKHYNIIRCS